MAEIILRTIDNTFVDRVTKVLSCTATEKLSTEKTLSFEVLLNGNIESVHDGISYAAEFENDFYDVTEIKKSLQSGLYKISFDCEHVSYRLTDKKLAYFANNGTLRETLTKLLGGTGFSCGDIPETEVQAFSIPSTSTVRAVILDLAKQFGMEVRFHQYYVSMYPHRGSTELKPLTDRNIVSISKSSDCINFENSYACTLRSPANISLGDEVTFDFSRLDIHENVRIIGIKRQPFSSKNVEIEVDHAEKSLETEAAEIAENTVNQNKSYYGVRLGSAEGLSVTRSDGSAKVILNSDEFKMQAAGKNGSLEDRIFFDPLTSEYKFVGNVTIDGGTIDIGGNFKVDEYGNVYMTGDSTIYGGRYYAGTPESIDGYSEMTSRGFDVFNSANDLKLRFGYTTSGEDYPFIQLGSGSGSTADYGLVKKFTDGLWIGNSDPADESGEFKAKEGYNGIFFKFSDNTAYIVRNTVQKNIYTGAAIARFG